MSLRRGEAIESEHEEDQGRRTDRDLIEEDQSRGSCGDLIEEDRRRGSYCDLNGA
jgi:hypothetical protein